MGLFDININKELEKETTLDYLEKKLYKYSNETISKDKNLLTLEKFKSEKSILKYNLKISTQNFENKKYLRIEGELQNVWIFVILVILSILLTQGLGIIPVILFVYYQKVVNTKFLEDILDNFKNMD